MSEDQEAMEQAASGTIVCCLLCRGWIKDGYKEGNIDRFKSHMENEHALVFNLEYMLASSLMDQAMVEEVANSVKVGGQAGTGLLEEQTVTSLVEEQQDTRKEETLGENIGLGDDFVQKEKKYEENANIEKSNKNEDTSLDMSTMSDSSVVSYPSSVSVDSMETSFGSSEDNIFSSTSLNYSDMKAEEVSESDLTTEMGNDSKTEEENPDEEKSPLVGNQSPLVGNLKTHVCSLCGKASSNRNNLKAHVKKKHPEQDLTGEFLESCKASGEIRAKSKAFLCSFPPCPKSYSNKVSIRSHEIKEHGSATHGRGGRRKSVGNSTLDVSPAKNDTSSLEELKLKEEESRLREEELARIKAEYYDVISRPAEEVSNQRETIEDVKTFLTDSKIEFNEQLKNAENEEQDNPSSDEPVPVDTAQSKYFIKNPNVFANARGKSLKLFSEEATGLPAGWKMRSIEREGKEGVKLTSIRHYLTPDQKVLKTGLAVMEYLRIEGKLGQDQLNDVRVTLKISERKMKELFE